MVRYFIELLNRTFRIWCMKNWQKTIDKEINLANKYNRKSQQYRNKSDHHQVVARKLYDEYCKLYPKEKEQVGDSNV